MNDTPTDQTEPQAQAPNGNDARTDPSLDDLLNEYESGAPAAPADAAPVQQPADAQQTELHNEMRQAVAWINQQRQESDAKRIQDDLKSAADVVKGHIGDDTLSDKLVLNYINGAAGNDPRLLNAWAQRHADPQGWGRVLKGVSEELRTELASRPDPDLTADRNAARNAVSTQAARRPDSGEQPSTRDMTAEEVIALSDKMGRDNAASGGRR